MDESPEALSWNGPSFAGTQSRRILSDENSVVNQVFQYEMRFRMRLLGYVLIFTALGGTAFAQMLTIPEIDPANASSAIALLVGGYLVAVSKSRRN